MGKQNRRNQRQEKILFTIFQPLPRLNNRFNQSSNSYQPTLFLTHSFFSKKSLMATQLCSKVTLYHTCQRIVTFPQRQHFKRILQSISLRRQSNANSRIEAEYRFFKSILPFNPDTLRNSNQTICWQIKSSPLLKKEVQRLYILVVQTEISNILRICSFRNSLSLSWKNLINLIMNDLQRKTSYLHDSGFIEESLDLLMKIRKWMEIWIEVDQKDILNIGRWVGKDFEKQMKIHYQNVKIHQIECECHQQEEQDQQRSISHKKAGLRIKNQKKSLNKNYKDFGQVQYGKEERDNTESQSKKSRNRKQKIKSLSQKKLQCFVRQNTKQSTEKYRVNKHERTEKAKAMFLQYIYVLLCGEANLNKKREGFKNVLSRVLGILNLNLLNKKNNKTHMSKVIKFIDQNSRLSEYEQKLLKSNLLGLDIQNDVLTSIFKPKLFQSDHLTQMCQRQRTQATYEQGRHFIDETDKQSEKSKKLKRMETNEQYIKQCISKTLKMYCLIKSRLIKLSKQIIKQKLWMHLYEVINPQRRKQILKETLRQNLLSLGMQLNEKQLIVVMTHFGNEYRVTEESFAKVFQIQAT